VVDPALAVDAGFALSVCATGALVLIAPRWCEALQARGVPAVIAATFAAPAAAQVVCGPIVAALAGGVSLVAVPANLLAGLAVAPATLLGVAAAVVSVIWPDGAALLTWVASWPARWLVAIAHVGAGIPAGGLPWPAGLTGALLLAGVSAGVWASLRWPLLRRYVLVAALAAALGAVPLRIAAPGWPPPEAVVVACDVGQGDALVLPVGGDEAVVVDAGPDPVPVDGCLTRLGIDRVVLLVLTHFHVDHIGGIDGVLRHRRVDAVVVPDFDDPAAGRAAVNDATAPLVPTAVGPGWTFLRHGLRLALVGPARRQTGTRSDPNNNSLVLRAERGSTSVLLAGDAEAEEQQDLAVLGTVTLRADILKLAHHGSAYQDEAS
jgi:competence protein ComEC